MSELKENAILQRRNETFLENTLKDNEEEYEVKVQESKHDILLLERTKCRKTRLTELRVVRVR